MSRDDGGRERADGRRLRGEENRRRIVEAVLALVGEGQIAPSAEEVATRADVGLRTVFRHFDDMDSLYREIAERIAKELLPVALAPLPEGTSEERLEVLVERRARVFEKMMPFKIAADVHRHGSPFLRDDHAQLTKMQRRTLRAALPERLVANPLALDALDLLLGFDAWRVLRKERGLSVAVAKKTMLYGALAILDAR